MRSLIPLLLTTTLLSTPILSAPTSGRTPKNNCLTTVEVGGNSRVLVRMWYDVDIDLTEFGHDYLLSNVTVTDLTPNYPAPGSTKENPKYIPVIGEFATSRAEFVRIDKKYGPMTREVTGNVTWESLSYDVDNKDCHHITSTFGCSATLQKNYAGRKAGDAITWTHVEDFHIHDLDPKPANRDFFIGEVTVTMDWSNFYA